MAKEKYETQFSIYKVDYDQSVKYFKESKKINIRSYQELKTNILNSIIEEINEKRCTEITNLKYNNFDGILFKTKHYPSWYGMMRQVLTDSGGANVGNLDIDITNVHISYVLCYMEDSNIFLLTGGLGSSYITEYTKKNYGLYLLPKIMKENTPVIRSVLENRLSGNRLSNRHSNRNVTTINIENDIGAIFRELSLEVDSKIVELLGIEVDNSKKIKNLNIDVKDSLVVKKSIGIDDLATVLNQLIHIEQIEDNFSLGYFVDIKKHGYSSQYVNELFINSLANRKYDNFILVGNEYTEYCIGGSSYVINDIDGNCVLEKDSFITMQDIYDNCLPEKPSKTLIEKFMRYTLTVYDSDNNIILYPTKIKQCMQGIIESDEQIPFLLFNGNWLMFDSNYVGNLDSEYRKTYRETASVNTELTYIIKNKDSKATEDSYNTSFAESDRIIVTHKVFSNNVELADLIYYDDDNLYLIHNKWKFRGSDARDLFNQILVSSELISHYLMEKDKRKIFEEYYDAVIKKYPNNIKMRQVSKEEFVDLFKKPNIYYIAGFMENLSEDIRSNYVKYLVLDINKKLHEKGYNFLLFNING